MKSYGISQIWSFDIMIYKGNKIEDKYITVTGLFLDSFLVFTSKAYQLSSVVIKYFIVWYKP